jgi:23S rRNA (cytosine1962-C5)-methyltransferase
MKFQRVQLSRNLRRTVLQGHPWIFKEAVKTTAPTDKAGLAQVIDSKGDFLAWALLDPHGPLCLRILSLDKTLPSEDFFQHRFHRAQSLRQGLSHTGTNAYRLFNGEGDLLPGLVCDIYDAVAVVQFDGQGPSEFWNREFVATWLLANTQCRTVIEKTRRNTERTTELLAGPPTDSEVVVQENEIRFKVNLEKGQKTGFFLDQRDNRNFVRTMSKGKKVLNLFSYTGGFSIYAGRGGAAKVASLDVSQGAIQMANDNWALNGLPLGAHDGLALDVFDYLSGEKELWDHIIVDPPSMSHSESQASLAKAKYIELFAFAIKRVHKQGQISLSSCSSHVSFNDFFEIINESLSQVRRKGQVLRVSGQGLDHPFPHACHELRYLKFVHLTLD